MSGIQIIRPENIQYDMQAPAEEEKNFIEGVFWGVNGVTNFIGGVATAGGIALLDFMAIGAAVVAPKEAVLAGTVGLLALNILAIKVIHAEFTIAGKSFTHMKNTIL